MINKFNLEILRVGALETNCYLVSDPGNAKTLVIDPGGEGKRIVETIRKKKLLREAIINTHGHADHTGANQLLKKTFDIDIYMHKSEEVFLENPFFSGSNIFVTDQSTFKKADVYLEDGSEIRVGGMVFKVIHTPGHSAGGICLAVEGAIFSGDTLFRGDIGRSDLPGGDEETLMRSLKIFSKFPKSTAIYPGHGPSSTLEYEFSENPYLT
jgi:hydroxyacylglutathione hydrolase